MMNRVDQRDERAEGGREKEREWTSESEIDREESSLLGSSRKARRFLSLDIISRVVCVCVCVCVMCMCSALFIPSFMHAPRERESPGPGLSLPSLPTGLSGVGSRRAPPPTAVS